MAGREGSGASASYRRAATRPATSVLTGWTGPRPRRSRHRVTLTTGLASNRSKSVEGSGATRTPVRSTSSPTPCGGSRNASCQRQRMSFYRRLMRLHILPTFGDVDLDEIAPPHVRSWRAERRKATGATTVAKSYRLLKAIMETAADDELIRRNPCRIKGAGRESAPEPMPWAPAGG